MKIQSLQSYQIPLKNKGIRLGVLVNIMDEKGKRGWGDVAPLPGFSQESLDSAISQLKQIKETHIVWAELEHLSLYPSVHFGLESAILSILKPLPSYSVPASALLMGTKDEILEQAKLRQNEGFRSAKLKVSNLSFDEASQMIHELKDRFYLRIDVNRAWETEESLRFFTQFPKDAFDYVEEPFKNPKDLSRFTHPLAVDESFPHELTLAEIEKLPVLKALIYKPTIQGGWVNALPLHAWAKKRGVQFVLSSSFESSIGLTHVASIARRLSITTPIGVGTYHHMEAHANPLLFSKGYLHVHI